jgi:hypothetical protein
MKTVKIFTYLDRQTSPFLPLWINYYTKNIKADLCILHKNVHLGKLDVGDNIEVINIDHFFNSSTQGEWIPPAIIFNTYQEQFLKTHDVVIYCDVDEFIIYDDLDNLVRSNYSPCLVTTGIEIVEKYPTDLKFDFTKNINEQRNHMIKSKWYDKPLIVNSPINWLGGKHNHDTFNNYVDGLYLIHLGRVCLETYVNLWEDTRKIYPSSTYLGIFNKEWYIEHFNNPNHPDHPIIEIPQEIKKFLNKII